MKELTWALFKMPTISKLCLKLKISKCSLLKNVNLMNLNRVKTKLKPFLLTHLSFWRLKKSNRFLVLLIFFSSSSLNAPIIFGRFPLKPDNKELRTAVDIYYYFFLVKKWMENIFWLFEATISFLKLVLPSMTDKTFCN